MTKSVFFMFCNDTALHVNLKPIYDKKSVFHVLACEKSVRLDMNLTIYMYMNKFVPS